jgi:hypothetical protein
LRYSKVVGLLLKQQIKMIILDNYLDRKIGIDLMKANDEERANHISSGKLSASCLGDPLQWQILKAFGVSGEPIDEYVVRKFKRGNHVEEWILPFTNPALKQEFVEYRNVVGYIDAVVDTKDWDFPKGVIPVEVKSVSNAKFKRIVRNGPDVGHCLQACLYALGTGKEWFSLVYIATDDYRVQTFIIPTSDWSAQVDEIITRYDKQLETGLIPVFEAREKWQSNKKYCRFPEYMEKTADELEIISKQLKK